MTANMKIGDILRHKEVDFYIRIDEVDNDGCRCEVLNEGEMFIISHDALQKYYETL